MKTVAIAFLVLTLQAAAQQPARGAIQGIVVAGETGTPLAKATVDVLGPTGTTPLYTTQSNADGRFFLPNIAPGKYRLAAMRAGYVRTEYGQRRPGGPSLDLTVAPGQRLADIRMSMIAGGVVSGRITDKGQPVGIANVIAMKPVYNDGQTTMVPVLTEITNDLGEYRLFWLPPGRYHILAIVWDTASRFPHFISPEGSDDDGTSFYTTRRAARAVLNRAIGSGAADNEAHVPIYFPGTADPERASIIDVKAGSDIRNIDIQADAVITRRVRGRITGAASVNASGQPVLPQMGMLPLTSSLVTNIANAPVDSTGAFEIPRVIPGRYVLYALSRGSVGNVTGRALIDVNNEDVNGAIVNLVPSIELSGRVVIERQPSGASPDPGIPAINILLRPDPTITGIPTGTTTPSPDGTFKYPAPNAPPLQTGTYRVIVNPILTPAVPPGGSPPSVPQSLNNAYVKSIRFGNEDVLNGGLRLTGPSQDELVIVVGTNPGSLAGRVVNGTGQSLAATTVVLIPEGGLKFRVDHKFAFTDASGAFQIQGIPPGNYQIYAFEQIEKGDWQDPGIMRAFENRGKPLRIEEGSNGNVEVTAIPAP